MVEEGLHLQCVLTTEEVLGEEVVVIEQTIKDVIRQQEISTGEKKLDAFPEFLKHPTEKNGNYSTTY